MKYALALVAAIIITGATVAVIQLKGWHSYSVLLRDHNSGIDYEH